jgi:uncharacterized membrane protein YphA (DoxX/SURF4 family)
MNLHQPKKRPQCQAGSWLSEIPLQPVSLQQPLHNWLVDFVLYRTILSGTTLTPNVALLIIIGESLGSLGLIAGFLTRMAAFGVLLTMIGAIVLVHWPHGFFMNWFGKQAGEGFEYHLLAIGISLVLLLYGEGKWSVDRIVVQRLRRT